MTQLPTLTLYQGAIPDKATMDRITFANSVHDYLNYFAISFTPETNDLVTKLNTLSGEIQAYAYTASSAAQTAQDARDAALAAANFKGVWDSSIQYAVGDTTIYNGILYLALLDNVGTAPENGQTWKAIFNIVYRFIDSNYTAADKEYLLIDTSTSSVVVTLPQNPQQFATIGFLDIASKFETNNLLITRGDTAHTIMGIAEDMIVDKSNIAFELIFYNGDWRLK